MVTEVGPRYPDTLLQRGATFDDPLNGPLPDPMASEDQTVVAPRGVTSVEVCYRVSGANTPIGFSFPNDGLDKLYGRARYMSQIRETTIGEIRESYPLPTKQQLPRISKLVHVDPQTEDPLAHRPNAIFYIPHNLPRIAPPVKAWRGYGGNVYFEPMKTRVIGGARKPTLPLSRSAAIQKLHRDHSDVRRGANDYVYHPSARQMSILDKTTVAVETKEISKTRSEDLKWITGNEALGSLRLGNLFDDDRLLTAAVGSEVAGTTRRQTTTTKAKRQQSGLKRLLSMPPRLPPLEVTGGRMRCKSEADQYKRQIEEMYRQHYSDKGPETTPAVSQDMNMVLCEDCT